MKSFVECNDGVFHFFNNKSFIGRIRLIKGICVLVVYKDSKFSDSFRPENPSYRDRRKLREHHFGPIL